MMKVILTYVFDRKKVASKVKAGVVELRISSEKKRKYISTGVKLHPKEWVNGSVVGRVDWKELNDQLQGIKKKCSEIINQMIEDGCFDIDAVPRLLQASIMQNQTLIDYMKEQSKTRFLKLAAGTKKRYMTFFKFMEEWKGIVSFADVTERNIMKMDECLVKRGLKESSRYNYHKILKSFIIRAVNDGLLKRNPYINLDIKKGVEAGVVKHLTPEEFHRFESCKIEDKCLARVRDLFVFQTYTALGYSDLEEFDYSKCTRYAGQVIYKGKRHKTGQDFTIVLLKPALAIIKKYNGKLPIISNVKYNLYLKAAVKYAKIDKPVTTHWARHTGATILLNEGKLPMHIVQHILGHATIRETERTYAKVLDKSIVESMANYQMKWK
jgi:integrase